MNTHATTHLAHARQHGPLITHVLPTLSPYGAERVAVELAARLPAHGFRTRLVVLFGEGPLSKELRERDIRWSPVLSRRTGSRVTLVQELRTKLFADLERTPSIIHTHLFGSDFWTSVTWGLERLRGRAIKIPQFVSTAHNVDREDSTLRRLARRWSARRMDKVVAISDEVVRYTHEELGVSKQHIVTIPNGIDLVKTHARGGAPFRDVPRLLMVGRLEPQKGHETALRALAQVHAPWQLEIVGAGSLARELKEVCERVGIASRVHFLGERNDVPVLMAQADLLLFPSRWEGMAITLLEALAAGLPVIASDLPALRAFMPRESLLPSDDPEGWTRAITALLADPSSAVGRAQRLAPDIRKRYDVDIMVERYAKLYREMMN